MIKVKITTRAGLRLTAILPAATTLDQIKSRFGAMRVEVVK